MARAGARIGIMGGAGINNNKHGGGGRRRWALWQEVYVCVLPVVVLGHRRNLAVSRAAVRRGHTKKTQMFFIGHRPPPSGRLAASFDLELSPPAGDHARDRPGVDDLRRRTRSDASIDATSEPCFWRRCRLSQCALQMRRRVFAVDA